MTPRIITYFLCGMRHPTTGLSEDDLSRLTGSSSSSASCCSNGSSSSSSPSTSPLHKESQQQQQQQSSNGSIGDQVTQLTTAHNGSSSSALDAEHLKNLKNSSSHAHIQQTQQQSNNGNNGNGSKAGSHFNSSYLPEFIDPLDWQRSRKRKERLDSTSSTTQDRKLIRSNSEELLSNDDNLGQRQTENRDVESTSTAANSAAQKLKQHADAIRRVASEDFKKSPYCLFDQRAESADAAVLDPAAKERAANINGSDENNAFAANRQQYETLPAAHNETTIVSGPTKDMTRRSRFETSPARSHRHSPNRNGNSKHHRDSDDSECEHERRRSSERFCKSRAPPGRKAAGVMKKSGKYLPTKMRGDENAYKYDLSALKYERRGFNSKKPNVAERSNGADYNDNNLIDFHIIRNGSETQQVSNCVQPQPVAAAESQMATPSQSSNNLPNGGVISTSSSNNGGHTNKNSITSAEALPWDSSTAADPTEPILSRRYATVRHRPLDCIDTAAKLSKVMPYPQQFHKQSVAQLMDDDDCIDPLNAFRAFASLENLKTRDVMQQVIPAMMSFQSPDERLKQVNKRLTALKKKLTQFEQVFETKMGYRPSQAEKLNDKYMKNVLAEIGKLRKEKHELKMNPMGGGVGGALGMKVSGGMDAAKKLEKMKSSLSEIEQNLSDKRQESNRSQTLDDLSADQLLQEKTAVQHGLLYFESLYGRPSTKDERDAARPIYDRYRQLKRMVSRSVTLAGAAAGAPELPTILEHEAMVFESTPQQYSSNTSTDSSNNTLSSSETLANASTDTSDDSTTTTTGVVEATSGVANVTQSMSGENISALSIEQLWEQLDKTCEEKKMLKRIIREYETVFEEQNGRKMLKGDRKNIEETYALYKEKKAKTRLLQALIKKHVSR